MNKLIALGGVLVISLFVMTTMGCNTELCGDEKAITVGSGNYATTYKLLCIKDKGHAGEHSAPGEGRIETWK
ncbi:MAG: hypothetical protein LBG76_10310 [Treponema sp.]|jgi:hypothetical protein|nr:hypothetical protein [Treponema sp.]